MITNDAVAISCFLDNGAERLNQSSTPISQAPNMISTKASFEPAGQLGSPVVRSQLNDAYQR